MPLLTFILENPAIKPLLTDGLKDAANSFIADDLVQNNEFTLTGCTDTSTLDNIQFCDTISVNNDGVLFDVDVGLKSVSGLGSLEITELDYEVSSNGLFDFMLDISLGLAVYNVTPSYEFSIDFAAPIVSDIEIAIDNDVGTLTAQADASVFIDCEESNSLVFAVNNVTFSEPNFIDPSAILAAVGLTGVAGAALEPIVNGLNNLLSGDISSRLEEVLEDVLDEVQITALPCILN
eukprot:CAMPEP_0118698222 /NCGR_PEP_ID=MMETSP0800-20121206/15061_1 /TAXON_ID=210618 ORGANISM="Striatella unipunctata, Strain CCMP2910" /NCGR_SAMPLE_ID=MMETSP0800 /ASSEMBLY_ACC=CAM_ASM_000638 /LENGTH=234 /DNA_ID=CAMNT_0006597979 /DNA_START=20 /DNA_END=724 /DNA_ORIENTATION=-